MSKPTALSQEQIIESAWLDQARWSETANNLKAEIVRWRKSAAIAGVSGAFLEVLATSLAVLGESWFWPRALVALAGAAILSVVPFVVKTKTSKDQVRAWIRARSTSEALKEMIYRYLLRVEPFKLESTPSDLIIRCQVIKETVQDLNIHAASIGPSRKSRPLALNIDDYVEKRVNDQIENYYRPKSRANALAYKKFHGLEFKLSMLAVIMGALSGAAIAAGIPILSTLSPWAAVLTTASAAVAAHIAASHYDHQAMIYYGTADRLTSLRDEWRSMSNRLDPFCIAKFVNDCEHAISTENEAWLAKWTEEEPNK